MSQFNNQGIFEISCKQGISVDFGVRSNAFSPSGMRNLFTGSAVTAVKIRVTGRLLFFLIKCPKYSPCLNFIFGEISYE